MLPQRIQVRNYREYSRSMTYQHADVKIYNCTVGNLRDLWLYYLRKRCYVTTVRLRGLACEIGNKCVVGGDDDRIKSSTTGFAVLVCFRVDTPSHDVAHLLLLNDNTHPPTAYVASRDSLFFCEPPAHERLNKKNTSTYCTFLCTRCATDLVMAFLYVVNVLHSLHAVTGKNIKRTAQLFWWLTWWKFSFRRCLNDHKLACH